MALTFPISLVGKRGGPTGVTLLGSEVSTASANPQIYSDFDIGDPDPNRTIIVSYGVRAGVSNWVGTNITIGGVQATPIIFSAVDLGGVALYKADVPTGTTATIQVSQPNGTTSIASGIQVYRVIANNLTIEDAVTTYCGGFDAQCGQPEGMVATVNTVPNGYVIAAGRWRSNPVVQWTNINSDGSIPSSGSSISLHCASITSEGSPITVKAKGDTDGKFMNVVSLKGF